MASRTNRCCICLEGERLVVTSCCGQYMHKVCCVRAINYHWKCAHCKREMIQVKRCFRTGLKNYLTETSVLYL